MNTIFGHRLDPEPDDEEIVETGSFSKTVFLGVLNHGMDSRPRREVGISQEYQLPPSQAICDIHARGIGLIMLAETV